MLMAYFGAQMGYLLNNNKMSFLTIVGKEVGNLLKSVFGMYSL